MYDFNGETQLKRWKRKAINHATELITSIKKHTLVNIFFNTKPVFEWELKQTGFSKKVNINVLWLLYCFESYKYNQNTWNEIIIVSS